MLIRQLSGVDVRLSMTLPDGTVLQMPPDGILHPLWIELACYLGKNFHGDWCGSEDAWVSTEFQRYASAEEFYTDSNIYLYHLIGYWLEGYKRPAHAWVYQSTGNIRASILDYGCGIGCDGIAFLDAGFDVSFADLPSKSLEFLRWRLPQRLHMVAEIYPLTPGIEIPRHDIVWCLDVLEHLPPHEHEAFLDHLATLGDSVILNLIDDKTADGTVHHPVDIAHLTAYIHQRWDCVYADYYVRDDGGKTRFVWYGDMVPESLRTMPVFVARKHDMYDVIEYLNSPVYHYLCPSEDPPFWTLCYIAANRPHLCKNGEWITAYSNGTPFPTYRHHPTKDRRLCKHCERESFNVSMPPLYRKGNNNEPT